MKSGSQNKKKARQSAKKAGYYQRQEYKTMSNKLRRHKKRIANKAKWAAKGVKKNGAPVSGESAALSRAAHAAAAE